jgi:hypothetical protein
MTSRDEREALARFSERYAVPAADVAGDLERRVIGATWGANAAVEPFVVRARDRRECGKERGAAQHP